MISSASGRVAVGLVHGPVTYGSCLIRSQEKRRREEGVSISYSCIQASACELRGKMLSIILYSLRSSNDVMRDALEESKMAMMLLLGLSTWCTKSGAMKNYA
jgi:hypothetical protein